MLGTAAVDYDRLMLQLDTETGEYADMLPQTPGHKASSLNYRKICGLELDPVFLEFGAGESVVLHNWLLHTSEVNETDLPRRAFSVGYLDGSTRRGKDGSGHPIVFGEGALAHGNCR